MLKNNPAALLVFLISSSPLVGDCDAALDMDGDGWVACTDPSQLNSQTCDCDDNNGNISPGIEEGDNLIDDDCDGAVEWIHGRGEELIGSYMFTQPLAYLADGSTMMWPSVHHSALGEKLPNPSFYSPDGIWCLDIVYFATADGLPGVIGIMDDADPATGWCACITSLSGEILVFSPNILWPGFSVNAAVGRSAGGVLIAGEAIPPGSTTTDAYAVALDADLDQLWTYQSGAPQGWQTAFAISEGVEGVIDILANASTSVQISQDGTFQWESSAPIRGIYAGILGLPDGGVLITGWDDASQRPVATRFDATGHEMWSWQRPGSETGGLRQALVADNGNLIVVGTLWGRYYIVELTLDGDVVREVKLPFKGQATGVAQTPDGGLMVGGWSYYDEYGSEGTWGQLMRLDSQWSVPPGSPSSGL